MASKEILPEQNTYFESIKLQETPLTPTERKFVKGAKKVIGGYLARTVLIFSAVLAGAGVVLENAEAQGPYTQNVNVDGHTVSIRQDAGAVPADVDRVRDDFVSLVNNSTVMRDRVIQAAPANQTKFVLVSRNRIDVHTAGADDASSTVFIDIADINVYPSFLKPQGIDANILASNFLKMALAHEFAHLLGIGDPQTQENAVMLPLFAIERTSYYGYCRQDGVEVLPYNVGERPGVALVEFNKSSYQAAGPGRLFPKLGSVCGGVGGIAELPEISESQQNTPSEKSTDKTIPITASVAAAAAAGALSTAGAILYKRRNR